MSTSYSPRQIRMSVHTALLSAAIAFASACRSDTGDANQSAGSGSSDVGGSGLNEYGNPPIVETRPSVPEISAEDLRTRVYAFAHDSMMGRQAGRDGNRMGTDYLARELARIGLEPAGDDGTWFQ